MDGRASPAPISCAVVIAPCWRAAIREAFRTMDAIRIHSPKRIQIRPRIRGAPRARADEGLQVPRPRTGANRAALADLHSGLHVRVDLAEVLEGSALRELLREREPLL